MLETCISPSTELKSQSVTQWMLSVRNLNGYREVTNPLQLSRSLCCNNSQN
jgi:hypothetical protein